MRNFSEYYEMYLKLHQNPINRRLHVAGQIATISWIYYCFLSSNYFLLLLSPFIVYPFAWTGHIVFEKNEPAAWKNPVYAKISDWVMMRDIILGKIPW